MPMAVDASLFAVQSKIKPLKMLFSSDRDNLILVRTSTEDGMIDCADIIKSKEWATR